MDVQICGARTDKAAADVSLRTCLRQPIPELYEAAFRLDQAVTAHLAGERSLAAKLIAQTNTELIRNWTESLWGKKSPYVTIRVVAGAPPVLPKEKRVKEREPTKLEERRILETQGFHCRFCGIPVIQREVRDFLRRRYPDQLPWGKTNQTQHAGFQALWLAFDHVLPHSRGGDNSLENIVVACAPCNCARMSRLVEEVGLLDPRKSAPVRSSWDGLQRVLRCPIT